MQYTIEARELTSEATHRPSLDGEPHTTTIEADDADEAFSLFLVQSASELVSVSKPARRGRESIATVKKDDSVFLVRVYAA